MMLSDPISFGLCPFKPSLHICLIAAHDPRHHSASVVALIAAYNVFSTTLVRHHTLLADLHLGTVRDPTSAPILQIPRYAHCSKTLAPESHKGTSCCDYFFPLPTAVSAASFCFQGSIHNKHCRLHPHTSVRVHHYYCFCSRRENATTHIQTNTKIPGT